MSYRYIGNKTQLTGALLEVFGRYVRPGARMADPMCGTASVSAALRQAGYLVTAGDLMTFAAQHAQVRLQLAQPPAFDALGLAYEAVVDRLNAGRPRRGLFWREYGPDGSPAAGCAPRRYFTADNAAQIDAVRAQLDAWRPNLTGLEHALLRHDLVLAANRVANIAGTYGHFRSSWSAGSLKPLHLQPTAFDAGPTRGHVVLQGPVERIASEISADACYLDPPYMKRQYAANYHILETLARGDEPDALGVSGLRDWWDQYSDFCSKRRIADAFAAVFDKMDCPVYFVSYSEDGLIPPDDMARLFADFGAVVRHDFAHKRFKSNGGGAGGTVTEYLYVIETR